MPARITRLSVQVAAALALCAAPAHTSAARASAPRALEQAVFARIKNVVVGGTEQTEGVTPEQVRVIRAVEEPGRTPTVEAGRAGMDLFPKDVVETGPDTNVTIVFVPDPEAEPKPEEYREVVLDQQSQLMVSNPERNTARLLWGRFVASVWGYFNSSAGSGAAAVRNTEFELCYPSCTPAPPPPSPENTGEQGTLTVLEGSVVYAQGLSHYQNEEPPDEAALWRWDFKLAAGQTVDPRAYIKVKNWCGQRHSFALKTPATLPWFTLLDNQAETLDSGAQKTFRVRVKLDAKEVPPEKYEGNVEISCADCEAEPGCAQVTGSWPFIIYVEPAQQVVVAEQSEVKFNTAGPLPTPVPASTPRLEEAAKLEAKVYVATQISKLTYIAPDAFGRGFASVEEMKSYYTQERIAAATQTDKKRRAEAFENLGDVYRAVGEDVKAVKAYRKVGDYDPERTTKYNFIYKSGEAYRGVGDFKKANEQFDAVPTKAKEQFEAVPNAGTRKGYVRAVGLSLISKCASEYGLAAAELKQGHVAAAFAPADRARRLCESVLTSNNPKVFDALGASEKAVFYVTYAQAFSALGTYYLSRNDLAAAAANYRKAVAQLQQAKAADANNPYVASLTSKAYTWLANVEKRKPRRSDKAVNDLYRMAEQQLGPAQRGGEKERREARILLGASRDTGEWPAEKDRADPRLTVGDATGAVDVPDLTGKPKDVAVEILLKAGFTPKLEYEDAAARRSRTQVVARQEPPPGKPLRKGNEVRLWLRASAR